MKFSEQIKKIKHYTDHILHFSINKKDHEADKKRYINLKNQYIADVKKASSQADADKIANNFAKIVNQAVGNLPTAVVDNTVWVSNQTQQLDHKNDAHIKNRIEQAKQEAKEQARQGG